MAINWVKLHCDLLDDEKLGALSERAQLRFVKLLLVAAEHDADGHIPMNAPALAWRLRADVPAMADDLAQLMAVGVLVSTERGYLVVNWLKRQGSALAEQRERWNERKRRQRQRDGNEEAMASDRNSGDGRSTASSDGMSRVTKANVPRDKGQCHTPRLDKTRLDSNAEAFVARARADAPEAPPEIKAQPRPPKRPPFYFAWAVVQEYFRTTSRTWCSRECADYLNANVTDAMAFGAHCEFFHLQGWNTHYHADPAKNALANVVDHYRNDRPCVRVQRPAFTASHTGKAEML